MVREAGMCLGILSLPSWAPLSAVAVAGLPGRDGGADAGGAAGPIAQVLVRAPLWAAGPRADPWAGTGSLVCLAGGQGSLGTHSSVRWMVSLQEHGHRRLNPRGGGFAISKNTLRALFLTEACP